MHLCLSKKRLKASAEPGATQAAELWEMREYVNTFIFITFLTSVPHLLLPCQVLVLVVEEVMGLEGSCSDKYLQHAFCTWPCKRVGSSLVCTGLHTSLVSLVWKTYLPRVLYTFVRFVVSESNPPVFTVGYTTFINDLLYVLEMIDSARTFQSQSTSWLRDKGRKPFQSSVAHNSNIRKIISFGPWIENW